jgi:hypothetical protein
MQSWGVDRGSSLLILLVDWIVSDMRYDGIKETDCKPKKVVSAIVIWWA